MQIKLNDFPSSNNDSDALSSFCYRNKHQSIDSIHSNHEH